jgi:peptide-methionine (S)-S-oxide reductase
MLVSIRFAARHRSTIHTTTMTPASAPRPSDAPALAPPFERITVGGGCFWCVEAVYELVDGVLSVESGYANGHVPSPTYEQVCSGTTGHAEVVEVRFDPRRIGLREVLEIFFVVHDPTTPDRQGNDVGPQYRSAIYWHEPGQEAVVRSVTDEVNAACGGRVVTELAPLQSY